MKKLRKVWTEAKHYLRKARDRFFGARLALRRTRKELAEINLRFGLEPNDDRGNGQARGDMGFGPLIAADLDHFLEQRGNILARKKSFADQALNRRAILKQAKVKEAAAQKAFEEAKERGDYDNLGSGVVIPDRPWNPNRKPVCAGFVPIIDRAWERGWRGILNSGFRSPAECIALCVGICGQAVCPGRCAGAGSRHAHCPWTDGAIDVSDQYKFDAVTPELFNALGAADPWHMSATGH